MLNIHSCVCWQSVYLLWRNVCLDLLRIFGLGCLFFWYWAVWAASIFCRLILCQLLNLQIFSPIEYVAFSFCWWFPLLCRSFLIWCNSRLFLLLLPVLLVSYLKNHCQNQCQGPLFFLMFSSESFMVSGLTFKSLLSIDFCVSCF